MTSEKRGKGRPKLNKYIIIIIIIFFLLLSYIILRLIIIRPVETAYSVLRNQLNAVNAELAKLRNRFKELKKDNKY